MMRLRDNNSAIVMSPSRASLWQGFLKNTFYAKITIYDNHKNILRNELKSNFKCEVTQNFQIGISLLGLRQKYFNCFI